ncbi:hypothetical protein E3T34_02860 [Cryobacterium sp. TMT1-62]|uniref:hypothetical protein n=1 Tax=Cryobacterium sp. TMT1-62 TaxID=1259240 RepID=UPI00106A05AA|nr:hypothetical protein [Cryobacterium sp. TMT1-62]TFD35500.1 hypothetical protein E3T34_02860 [Cryobacterium sp. TMT1-62]
MSRTSKIDDLVVGGEPRVDLLPPEVRARQKGKILRRGLAAGMLGVVVLVGSGVAAASWGAAQGRSELAVAQTRTGDLLAEQTKYIEVRRVQDELATSLAAREVGASTEIDWRAYLQDVREVLPADVTIDTVDIDSASPLVLYEQPTVPLQASRVATIMISMTSPNLPTVPEWLKAMGTLPGFADGNPGSITRTDTGAYLVDLTLHINESAYSNRFVISTEEK